MFGKHYILQWNNRLTHIFEHRPVLAPSKRSPKQLGIIEQKEVRKKVELRMSALPAIMATA